MREKIVKLLNCLIVKSKKTRRFESGQALVTLLVFVAITTTIIAGAVAVTIINSQTTSKFSIGEEALAVAEAGAENAAIKILRSPACANAASSLSLPTLPVGSGTANVTIVCGPTVTITSTGQVADFIRKIQITGTYSNNQFVVTSYSQVD